MAEQQLLDDAPAGPSKTTMKGVYFGGDATNPTLILRLSSFRAQLVDITGFTFRRKKFNTDFQPDWRNHHLGETGDRRYLLRILPLLRACRIIASNREAFEGAQFIYARMIDMALLALFAKIWHRLDAVLVYEIEDVQAIFFKKSLRGAFFRWIERRLLARTQLVVVMSPGFLHGYLQPVQGYAGPTYVLENKIQVGELTGPQDGIDGWRERRDKWVIGWFGTLRCERSMALLSEIAERLRDRVEIYTRGYPTETGLAPYLERVARHPNWLYEGEYKMPRDLANMYGRVHFTWCLDFLDVGGNSELLLACRMYQGGYYGSVPLVARDTEMDRFLAPHGIGHAFKPPYAENIAAFLEGLNWADYEKERGRIKALGPEIFLEAGADMRGLLDTIDSIARNCKEGATPRAGPLQMETQGRS
jgi:succinoglycan biosynthesis protein ExoL